MPDAGPREGSPEWIVVMKNNLELITFEHMSRFNELLRAWVKHEYERNYAQDHGFVRLQRGELVPTGIVYDSSAVHTASVLKGTRRHMEYHINLEFLRSGAVKYAFDKLRDAALYPRNMMRKSLPKHVRNAGYDNFEKVVNTFLTHYCFAQGLSRSSEVTRQVTTYTSAQTFDTSE